MRPSGFSGERCFQWAAVAVGVTSGCIVPLVCGRLLDTDSLPGAPRSDFEYYFYPLRCFLSRSLAQGTIPFWNPHLFCGYPVIETYQSAVFYPLNALGCGLHAREAIVYITALHLVLNYLAWAFSLRRGFGYSVSSSSIVAALANAAPQLPYRFFAGHLCMIFAHPWLPCLVAAAYQLSHRQAFRYHWWLVAAVSTALLLVSGAPQLALYAIYAALAIALVIALALRTTSLLLRVITALGLGAVLAFPQIISSLAYIPYSARQGQWGIPSQSAGVVATLLETFLPAPFGNGVLEAHINERGVWDTAGYFGAPALVAVLSWTLHFVTQRRKDSRATCAFALILAGIYIMSGGYLPGFRGTRENQRAIILVHSGSFLLLALFLDDLRNRLDEKCLKKRFGRAAAAFLVGGVLYFAIREGYTTEYQRVFAWISRHVMGQLTFSPNEIPEVAGYLFITSQRAFNLALGWLGLAVITSIVGTRFSRLGWLGLSGVLILDPLLVSLEPYRCRTPALQLGCPPDVETQIIAIVREKQVAHLPPCRFSFPTSLTNFAQCVEGVLDAGGYDPLMPHLALARRTWSTIPLTPEERQKNTCRALAICGAVEETKHQPEIVPPPCRVMSLRPASTGRAECAELSVRVALQPAGYLFGPLDGSVQTLETTATLEHVRNWFEQSMTPSPNVFLENNVGQVRWYHVSNPNRIWIAIHATRPGLLVIRSTWLPGWRVSGSSLTGEQEHRPFRCNGWMTGHLVPAGFSFVKLSYAPLGWRLSLFVSLLASATLILTPTGHLIQRYRRQGAART